MTEVEICCLRRSMSNVLEKLLEQTDIEILNGTDHEGKYWKHGGYSGKLMPGKLRKHPRIILTKHPYSQIRSQYNFFLWNDFKIPKLFEIGKKTLSNVSGFIPATLYAAPLDLWLHAYSTWLNHENKHIIHFEDFIRNPQYYFNLLTSWLDHPTVDIELPENQVQPRENGPTVTNRSFDKEFYIENRWTDWYSQAEKDWIERYVHRFPHSELFRDYGYETTFEALE